MANANIPMGLRPVRDQSNRMWTGGGNTYYVTSAHAGALYIGDPVIVTGSADAAGVPTVDIATAGATNYITGAIVGFMPDPTILANGYLPASTAGYVIVEDDPNVTYEIQANSMISANLNANSVLAAGTGNRITGSGWFMDTGTIGTSNTYQLRIVGIAQAPDNALGAFCKAHVRINLPTEAGLATGTGV